MADWQFLHGDRLGGEGRDAGTLAVHGIGKRIFGGRNWYPVTDERETVCGRFANSKLFSAVPVDPSEYDWNIFIDPSPAFQFSIDRHYRPRKNRLNFETCPGDTTKACLETEIGARKRHFSNVAVTTFP